MLMIQKVIDAYAELVTDEQRLYRSKLTESIEEQVMNVKNDNDDEILRRKRRMTK